MYKIQLDPQQDYSIVQLAHLIADNRYPDPESRNPIEVFAEKEFDVGTLASAKTNPESSVDLDVKKYSRAKLEECDKDLIQKILDRFPDLKFTSPDEEWRQFFNAWKADSDRPCWTPIRLDVIRVRNWSDMSSCHERHFNALKLMANKGELSLFDNYGAPCPVGSAWGFVRRDQVLDYLSNCGIEVRWGDYYRRAYSRENLQCHANDKIPTMNPKLRKEAAYKDENHGELWDAILRIVQEESINVKIQEVVNKLDEYSVGEKYGIIKIQRGNQKRDLCITCVQSGIEVKIYYEALAAKLSRARAVIGKKVAGV